METKNEATKSVRRLSPGCVQNGTDAQSRAIAFSRNEKARANEKTAIVCALPDVRCLHRAACFRRSVQFPYFNRKAFKTDDDFLVKLSAFLKALPKGYKLALVLFDKVWMPLPEHLKFDYVTADFSYVRLLGDRKGIEIKTKNWHKVIVNRSRELRSWVDVC